MNDKHPIEVALVVCLLLLELIAWCINEVTGGHTNKTKATHSQPKPKPKATMSKPQPKPFIQPLFIELQQLTVKQLRVITGQKSSRLRKHQLIQLAYTIA